MLLLVAAVLMAVFFAVGLHVATALGLIGVTMMYFFSDRPLLDMLGQIAWNTNSNFVLVAVPLFVMMGEVLLYGRISERLYTVLSHWLAPIRGGLLHSNIAFSAVFGAISGSSAASAATVGAVSLPSFWPEATASAGWSDHWRPVAPWISSFRRAFPWSFMGCSPRSPSAGCTWQALSLASCCPGYSCSSFTWQPGYGPASLPGGGPFLGRPSDRVAVAVSRVHPDVPGAGHHLSGGGDPY